MIKAFIFGKFLPFHKGHEAMINFALTKCDFLSVLVCCSEKENIPPEVRKNWIQDSFKSIRNIEVTIYNYKEAELPNTSESSQEVSKLWSEIFKVLYPTHDLVITSEIYGNYVASFMGIEHIAFDIPKLLYPISATAVRNDLFTNWKFLPQSVKPFFAIKIVILGTESTGKTTLTEKLVKHYNCVGVYETGRELIANSNSFQINDLYLVASKHAERIDKAVCGESPLIIIDTDVNTTISYSKFIFNTELILDDSIYKSNKADLYLYLNNKVKYFQDGTRLSEKKRNLLDLSNRNNLKQKSIEFIEIKGYWENRFESAVKEIDIMIKKKKLSV